MQVQSISELGRRVRARRREVDLTAAEVAQLARVSRRLLLEVEQGKRPNVGFANVLRVLEVLGLRLDVTPRGLPGTHSGPR
jgi:transcriptional regulator with XRE-family HTH domain